MKEKIKVRENYTEVRFFCEPNKNCLGYVAKKIGRKETCKYNKDYECISAVCKVNRMVLELQKLTGKKVVLE